VLSSLAHDVPPINADMLVVGSRAKENVKTSLVARASALPSTQVCRVVVVPSDFTEH